MLVDAHTHIFCWGEDPRQGFLSEPLRRRWLTRLLVRLTGIRREPGQTLTEKMRRRLLRHLHPSQLDYAVVLAQDMVYKPDGTPDEAATHFYVSNDYVLELARECPAVIPGCSINPHRRDALAELERCRAEGCRLIKVHTAIQGVDPDRPEFEPFYRLARDLGLVLMFHTGYEHAGPPISQQFTDPSRLARALDQGGVVIAAHCGSCAFFDRENYYPRFAHMMQRYDNLYGDTSILASLIRPLALRRLSREAPALRERILHGSDYPFPPSRLPYVLRTLRWPRGNGNPLDLDLRIKQAFDLGPRYESRILELLGLQEPAPGKPA
jgi:predicted TIM-barrel fold metal-dependent hydrolase